MLKQKIRVVLVKNQKERLKMAIKIDEARKTLVITAGFKKKASVFNSEEYTLLRQAKNENPGFKVEVRKTKRKNSPKLTLDFMRRYIDDLPDTEKKVNHKKAFNEMSGKLKDAEHRTRYCDITSWFVKTFPTYKDYSPIDAIVARARKKAEPTAPASQV